MLLLAGVLGALASAPIGALVGVHVSLLRCLTAVPLALAVAVVATAFPASRAARSRPANGLRPAVVGANRRRSTTRPRCLRRRPTRLRSSRVHAWRWALRTPGRTVASIAVLTIGIGAMGVLVGIDTGFHTSASGSLLSAAVGVRVRGVDEAAAVITLILAVIAAAGVIYLGTREREAELASAASRRRTNRDVRGLILWEGALVALCAALLGALLGAGATQLLVHTVPAAVYAALAVFDVIGVAVTLAACLLPAHIAARAPLAEILIAE